MDPDIPQRLSRQLLDECCDAAHWLAWNALTGLVTMGLSTSGHMLTPQEWVLAVGPAPRRGDRRIAREAKEGIRQIESLLANATPVTPPAVVRHRNRGHPQRHAIGEAASRMDDGLPPDRP